MAYWCIDPVDGNDGTGASQSTQSVAETTPFKTWAAVTWTAGHTYLQKSGTTAAEKINITTTGSAGNVITLGIYGGTAKAIINAAGQTQGIIANGKRYLTIEDLLVTGNPTNTGISVIANASIVPRNVTIRRCVCDGAAYSGIYIGHSSITSDYSGYGVDNLIEDCTAYNCGQHGIAVVGPYDGAIIRGSTAYNCALSSSGWNIYMGTDSLKYLSSQNAWTDLGSNQWRASKRSTIDISAVIFTTTAASGTRKVLTEDAGLTADWTFTHDTTTVTMRLAAGYSPNTGGESSTVIVYSNPQKNGIIETCEAYNALNQDGIAIGVDHYLGNGTIRKSHAYDSYGAGISLGICNGGKVESCVITNCGTVSGESMFLSTGTTAAVAYNNTIIQSGTIVGVSCATDAAATVTIENNIILGGAIGVGKSAAGSGTVNAGYNNITATTALGTDITDGGNNITTDPLLTTDYRLGANSPAKTAGKFLSFTSRDVRGRPFNIPPAIGAYAPSSRDPANTRISRTI